MHFHFISLAPCDRLDKTHLPCIDFTKPGKTYKEIEVRNWNEQTKPYGELFRSTSWRWTEPYWIDPVKEERDSGEDGGLFHLVAHASWTVTDNTMDSPGSVDETGQGTSRVALGKVAITTHTRRKGPKCQVGNYLLLSLFIQFCTEPETWGARIIPNITGIVVRIIIFNKSLVAGSQTIPFYCWITSRSLWIKRVKICRNYFL